MRVAAAQYPLTRVAQRAAWAEKIARWVALGAATGAELLLFPEYASLELAALLPEATRAEAWTTVRGLQALLGTYLTLHQALARAYRVDIVAGSFPVREGAAFYNRAYWFAPDGTIGWQDKWIATPFERARWGIVGRAASPRAAEAAPRLFATSYGPAGIVLCYDAEFPLLARRLVAAGAEWLLVPSCTDDWAGYHRVRIACQARALEGQCGVVQAVIWGDAPWLPALAVNRGYAGIFVPPDAGLPAEGVLARGGAAPGWVVAALDRAHLAWVRHAGAVRNRRDWALSE